MRPSRSHTSLELWGARLGGRQQPAPQVLPAKERQVGPRGEGRGQGALAHGVPLVVAGAAEEKPAIAALVAWSGAGAEPANRHARRIQPGRQRHDAPAEAAALLERLAVTRQPVLRERAMAQSMLPALS